MVEIGRTTLKDERIILFERTLLDAYYNFKEDSVTIVFEYRVNYNNVARYSNILKRELKKITKANVQKLNIKSDEKYIVILYHINIPASELEQKLPQVFGECDNKVIKTIKETANKSIEIRTIVERYFYF